MKEVEDIKVVNVDGTPYQVSDMSEIVQELVIYYNQWRKEEFEAKSELFKLQAAMRDMSREIVGTIKKEVEEAANKVETPESDVESIKSSNDV